MYGNSEIGNRNVHCILGWLSMFSFLRPFFLVLSFSSSKEMCEEGVGKLAVTKYQEP